MKRLILIVLVGCCWIGFVWAQPCQYSAQTSDGTCTNNSNCLFSLDGCTVLTFTPTCTGWYNIEAWTGDGQSNCCYGRFNSCVCVYENGGRIGFCHVSQCGQGDCYEVCTDAVCLIADHEYQLYVCLLDCEGGICDMPPPCTAYGKVKFHSSAACQ